MKAVTDHTSRPLLVCVVLALTAATACANSFTREEAAASFAEAHPEATAEQSDCVIDRLLDRYTIDELEAELSRDAIGGDFQEAQFRDMFACGIEGDVRTQIATQLVDDGVDEDKAPCVADALVGDMDDDDIDVLLSGEITDAFYEKFFAAMEQCGAVNQ